MGRSLKFFVISLFVLVSGLFLLKQAQLYLVANAAPLADTGDAFYVEKPRPSSKLVGQSEVRFYLVDDENAQPEYDVGLFRPDCLTRFGTIVANDYSIKQSNNFYSKSWNSDGPILDQASIPNGNYCLKVCVTLKNGDNNYSVCDLRPLSLVEKLNQNPVITSNVPNTLFLVGQTFGYYVQATDPDGDTLTYYLTTAPSFLQINSATGAITSKGALTQVGSFVVVVQVRDGNGGSASQQFTLKVEPEPTPKPSSIEIIFPAKDSVFRDDKDNSIEWIVSNISNISKITLFYSTDGQKWTKITDLGAKTTSYIWDAANVETGDYFIRVLVTTSTGKTYEDISEKFSLVSTKDEVVEDSASIIEVSPEEDKEYEANDQVVKEISATFVPSQGASVDPTSLVVLLDDKEITESCEISDNKLSCQISNSLSEGKHKVYVEFTDSAEKKASKTWYFTIKAPGTGDADGDGTNVSRTLLIILGICGLVFLLLFIPWLLFTLWRRRNESDDEVVVEGDYTLAPDADTYETQAYETPVNEVPTYEVPSPAPTVITSSTQSIPPTTVVEQSEPEEEDEFAIGESTMSAVQPVGQSTTQPMTQPMAQPTLQPMAQQTVVQPVSQPAQQPATPADTAGKQFGEEDIPDWLKEETFDDEEKKALADQTNQGKAQDQAQAQAQVTAASQPINASGNVIDLNTVDEQKQEDKGSQLYGDYGLATKDDSNLNGDSSSTDDNASDNNAVK